MKDGVPAVCNPDPKTHVCVRPYHDTSDRNAGGPHDMVDAIHDINRGRMNGFQAQARKGRFLACHDTDNPGCSLTPSAPDVMGYHDWHEIPNYWDYARNFVLQDHMFEADNSWSLPAHLALVSGWTARCSKHGDPMSCHSTLDRPLRRHRPRPEARLPVDRPDVAHAPRPCELALLRGERQRAGLRRQHDVLPARAAERADARHLEPAAALRRRAARPPARQRPAVEGLLPGRQQGAARGGLVDHALTGSERASARARHGRADLRHAPDQHDHERARLEVDRHLPRVGRLGRLLRPRQAPARRRRGVRDPRSGARDQPVREKGLRRPPGAELRRLPQVHRGRLPARPEAQPTVPTAGPTHDPTCGKTSRSWATSSTTSTSTRGLARRTSSRFTHRSAESRSASARTRHVGGLRLRHRAARPQGAVPAGRTAST